MLLRNPFDLVRLSPPLGRESWQPFGTEPDAHAGFERTWWARLVLPARDAAENRFFTFCDGSGRHVARLELDWGFPAGVYPTADAVLARPMLEVQLIEVHQDFRCRGVGTMLVRRIQATFPDHQLMALSEADGFWESLGWSRHRHCDDDGSTQGYRTMYLAP